MGAVGCGASCPPNATLHGGQPPSARAQWCERDGVKVTEPAPAATNEVLGVYRPTSRGRALDGAYIDWHASGNLRSHGNFTLRGNRALANGVWTFYRADGTPAVTGRYVFGVPVGCFAVWVDGGERLTFEARGGELVKHKCAPPRSADAEAIAERYRRDKSGKLTAEQFSFGVGFLATPNSVPATSPDLMQPESTARYNARIELRRAINRFKVGLSASVIGTDLVRTWSSSAALLGGLSLVPRWRPFDVEVSAELGVKLYSSLPRIDEDRVGTTERFFTPYGGLQLAAGYRFAQYASVYLAVLAQHDLTYREERFSRYCDPLTCVDIPATWNIGGGFVAGMLQLRLLVQ